MGLDLASFGAGFFGQAVKDRDANKEEERLAKRQAMLNKLQEESAIRTAQRKTTAGTPYKVGDKYYVQDTDGDGNIKGPAREARPDEVRAYEDGDLDRRTKTASTKTSEFQATNLEADRNMSIAERQQRMSLDREQNARGWAAENRMSSQDKESKAASKAQDKEASQIQKEASATLATIAKVPVTDPKDPQVRKLYDEVNLLFATKPVGYRSRIRMLKSQAESLAKARGAKDEGMGSISLDQYKEPNE